MGISKLHLKVDRKENVTICGLASGLTFALLIQILSYIFYGRCLCVNLVNILALEIDKNAKVVLESHIWKNVCYGEQQLILTSTFSSNLYKVLNLLLMPSGMSQMKLLKCYNCQIKNYVIQGSILSKPATSLSKDINYR